MHSNVTCMINRFQLRHLTRMSKGIYQRRWWSWVNGDELSNKRALEALPFLPSFFPSFPISVMQEYVRNVRNSCAESRGRQSQRKQAWKLDERQCHKSATGEHARVWNALLYTHHTWVPSSQGASSADFSKVCAFWFDSWQILQKWL